jgi:hypothetical protein
MAKYFDDPRTPVAGEEVETREQYHMRKQRETVDAFVSTHGRTFTEADGTEGFQQITPPTMTTLHKVASKIQVVHDATNELQQQFNRDMAKDPLFLTVGFVMPSFERPYKEAKAPRIQLPELGEYSLFPAFDEDGTFRPSDENWRPETPPTPVHGTHDINIPWIDDMPAYKRRCMLTELGKGLIKFLPKS